MARCAESQETIKDRPLKPGMELKVMRGPFDAVVHLDRRELRSSLRTATPAASRSASAGTSRSSKATTRSASWRPDPPYFGRTAWSSAPAIPKKPARHGMDRADGPHRHPRHQRPAGIGRDNNRGYICVGARDLQDLYGILTVGSRVTVVR